MFFKAAPQSTGVPMPMREPTSILVAFGGNAILKERQRGTAEEQFANLETALDCVADLVQEGHRVIITHGNGPQVGALIRQGEAAAGSVPTMPLDVLVAETQGLIGYMIQNTLVNIFRKRQIKRNVVSVITQVLVDASDPAFEAPSKGVGRFYEKEEAEAIMAARGDLVMREDAGRGWRRMVPSPEPIDVLEVDFPSNLFLYVLVIEFPTFNLSLSASGRLTTARLLPSSGIFPFTIRMFFLINAKFVSSVKYERVVVDVFPPGPPASP